VIKIVPKKGETFYVEPADTRPDLAFANTRLTEALHGKLIFEESVKREVIVGRKLRNFYEVKEISLLERIYTLQQQGNLPLTLWHRIGSGKYQKYQPHKAKRSLETLLKQGAAKGAQATQKQISLV
jgi:hypothetical protein